MTNTVVLPESSSLSTTLAVFLSSNVIPANSLAVGNVFAVKYWVTYDNGGQTTSEILVGLNGSTSDTSIVSIQSPTSESILVDAYLTITSTGSAGRGSITGYYAYGSTFNVLKDAFSIDTTQANYISVAGSNTTSDSNNVFWPIIIQQTN